LDEQDCLICGGTFVQRTQLSGAIAGLYPIYGVRVQVPQLGFDRNIEVVCVSRFPAGFDGYAAFRFLNRFTYGNFGDPSQFGLEV
jgi:hypothetical protein